MINLALQFLYSTCSLIPSYCIWLIVYVIPSFHMEQMQQQTEQTKIPALTDVAQLAGVAPCVH